MGAHWWATHWLAEFRQAELVTTGCWLPAASWQLLIQLRASPVAILLQSSTRIIQMWTHPGRLVRPSLGGPQHQQRQRHGPLEQQELLDSPGLTPPWHFFLDFCCCTGLIGSTQCWKLPHNYTRRGLGNGISRHPYPCIILQGGWFKPRTSKPYNTMPPSLKQTLRSHLQTTCSL
jgi:hypothetical protein